MSLEQNNNEALNSIAQSLVRLATVAEAKLVYSTVEATRHLAEQSLRNQCAQAAQAQFVKVNDPDTKGTPEERKQAATELVAANLSAEEYQLKHPLLSRLANRMGVALDHFAFSRPG